MKPAYLKFWTAILDEIKSCNDDAVNANDKNMQDGQEYGALSALIQWLVRMPVAL